MCKTWEHLNRTNLEVAYNIRGLDVAGTSRKSASLPEEEDKDSKLERGASRQ